MNYASCPVQRTNVYVPKLSYQEITCSKLLA